VPHGRTAANAGSLRRRRRGDELALRPPEFREPRQLRRGLRRGREDLRDAGKNAATVTASTSSNARPTARRAAAPRNRARWRPPSGSARRPKVRCVPQRIPLARNCRGRVAKRRRYPAMQRILSHQLAATSARPSHRRLATYADACSRRSRFEFLILRDAGGSPRSSWTTADQGPAESLPERHAGVVGIGTETRFAPGGSSRSTFDDRDADDRPRHGSTFRPSVAGAADDLDHAPVALRHPRLARSTDRADRARRISARAREQGRSST